jgi:hypothetical protein
MVLTNRWLKDIHRVGYIVFLFIFWFFHYGTIRLWANTISIGPTFFGSHWIFFPIWTLAFLVLSSGFLWRKITSPETITLFLNIVCILIITFSIARISLELIPRYHNQPDANVVIKSLTNKPNHLNRPDIYYIILDGYARNDILQELYNYHNSLFINSLKDKGFFIATKSQSNYGQTALSLASSLNMEYLSGFPKTLSNRSQLIGMIRNNKIFEIFEYLGYKIVTFSTGYALTDIQNSNYYYSIHQIGRNNNLEALLIINSIGDLLIEQGWINLPISRYRTEQDRINYIFTTLSNEVPLISSPKMVFAHIIAPHPPFIFDLDGIITPDEYYFLQDGNTFKGSREEYILKYIDQLRYINNGILKAIDGIQANSPTPPIIILQADHGPGAYLDQNSIKNTCLKERFSILNAYYFPKGESNHLQEDITPVNTFPIVLNTYFGTNINLLSNDEFYSTWKKPFEFINVTEQDQLACDMR